MRQVRGRRGQIYVLCLNDAIPVKYPALPVSSCVGYRERPHDGSVSESPP
jgi:hypothetical protein